MKTRGYLIRQMCQLVEALNVNKAVTVKQIEEETGLHIRQVYRWLDAMQQQGLIDKFGKMPARYRLKKRRIELVRRKEFGHMAKVKRPKLRQQLRPERVT